jgi:hypothetical protein
MEPSAGARPWLSLAAREELKDFPNQTLIDEYMKNAAKEDERAAAKAANREREERDRQEREGVKRRRLAEMEEEVLHQNQLEARRASRDAEWWQKADARLPNQMPYKRLLTIVQKVKRVEWVKELYPWMAFGDAPHTHRIHFRGMAPIVLTSDVSNRTLLLDTLDRIHADHEALYQCTVQELFKEQFVTPFFDLEPNYALFRSSHQRRSNEDESPRLTLDDILAVLARVFSNWPLLAWLVYRREAEGGTRYHIRVRNLDGSCPMVQKAKFRARANLAVLPPFERHPDNTRLWLGWDLQPYSMEQMRYSNCAKMMGAMSVAERALAGPDFVEDLRLYEPAGWYSVEHGRVVGRHVAFEPYSLKSCKAASSLPFGDAQTLVYSRDIDPEHYDIVGEWQLHASNLPRFGLPLHPNLEHTTFSWNWRPSNKRSLNDELAALPVQSREAWKPIALRFVRVVFGSNLGVLVLHPSLPLKLIREGHKDIVVGLGDYSCFGLTRDEFKKQYDTFSFEEKKDGRTKTVGFASTVLKTHYSDVNGAIFAFTSIHQERIFNKWPGPAITPNDAIRWTLSHRSEAKRAVQMFLQHVKSLTGGDATHLSFAVRRYNMWCFSAMLHFLLAVFVRPFDRHAFEFVVWMQGPPGSGKGTFFTLFQLMVGGSMCNRMEGSRGPARAAAQFNTALHHLLVYLDELDEVPIELLSVMKSLTTEEEANREGKFKDAGKTQAVTHFLASFNEMATLPKIDAGERRIIVTEGVKLAPEFFDEYYDLMFNKGGVHAVACYLYSLHSNKEFAADAKGAKVGPLKSTMFNNKSATFAFLMDNCRSFSWFGTFTFPFHPANELVVDPDGEPSIWRAFFATKPNVSEVNYWLWMLMGSGFEERWPPFVPLKGLVNALLGSSTKQRERSIEVEINETLKQLWPVYKNETWPEHPIYSKLQNPVVYASEIVDAMQTAAHKGCQKEATTIGDCKSCLRPLAVGRIQGWNPGKTKDACWDPITEKVVLLPRLEDAAGFYGKLFPGISDIGNVYFPRNWQPDRFYAMVDVLGERNEALPLLELDEEGSYFAIGGPDDTPDRQRAIEDDE